jgi:nucleoside 2-deoxyribosyltransferase
MSEKHTAATPRTIYLCGPINGRTTEDATNWRELVKERWMGGGGRCLDPMARDYRGRELEPGIAAEIVAGDIEDIQNSDAILVFFDKPSVGTAMEVFYAKHVLKKPVVVIDASDKPLSPWLLFHSDSQTKHVSVALATINMLLNKAAA